MRSLAQLFSISFGGFMQMVILRLQGAKQLPIQWGTVSNYLFRPHRWLVRHMLRISTLMGIITGEIHFDGLGTGACL